MNLHIFRSVAFACPLLLALAGTGLAAPNWKALVPFYRVEADPSKSYELTDGDGPWLIVATTFSGETGKERAHELVLEFRKKYGWKAYIHKQHYDFTGEVKALGLTPDGRPKTLHHRRSLEFESYAVLVGDFQSIYGDDAKTVLDKIKHAKPICLDPTKIDPEKGGGPNLGRFREALRLTNPELKELGPMRMAFISRNPLLPAEFFAPKGLDPLVVKMNKDVEFSLLKNPGRYSVRVGTYRGNVSIGKLEPEEQAKWSQAAEQGSSKLAIAAIQAHRLTLELRKRGVEAYEFHDRHESIVTVGSFAQVGEPRADGKTEINPGVHRIMQSYSAKKQDIPGYPEAGLQQHTLAGIPFDVQPVPVEVPRVSIASDYADRGTLLE